MSSNSRPSLASHLPSLAAVAILFFAAVAQSLKVTVLFDSSNHLHRDIQYHPEQPARIDACRTILDQYRHSLVKLVDVAPESSETNHAPFSEQELSQAHDMLLQTHTPKLVRNLQERCRNSKQQRIQDGKAPLGFIGYVDSDTYVTTESFDVCLRAAATWIRAVQDSVEDDNKVTFALTRPPGHHATKSTSNGFCLYNFAATATLFALQLFNWKVSVLDIDVHYGQGVADILKSHSSARYVSIHQTPAFPYMGETRKVQGEHGNILTIPIPPDSTWTCGYQQALLEYALDFVCNKDEWVPDLILICAGYDALDSDELASVNLRADDYGRIVRALLEHVAAQTGKRSRIVLGLEGGYQLADKAGGNLPRAVLETVKALVEWQ